MYHKILVAVDKSEMTQYVFEQGVFLAKAADAEMMLLHILSPLEDPYLSPIFTQPDTIYPSVQTTAMDSYIREWEEVKKQRLDWLRSLSDTAISAGVKTGFTQNLGDAGRIICEVARNWPADLIIVGRRGRTGISEFLLGSVSNYVLHHAPCSSFIVQGHIPTATEIPPTV
ncbi:universal stress protein [Nodularia sphaerocarpa]|uniref:universal stress protein n=1 Tax=Nodularia sphaerocarpa TaxID=137816 RepID=UPI001EFC109D|nr:universal stress protein [Nodularia sphaerocarpa]MDB9374662.1 universal stress protein [Nodularia sphaerocarpa CS-585]MDB9379320.1 universal stress protein [Nodularia sphaerocarpa CS-585A2]ULP73070.1 Putative universal stress protein [Nodularia sphaerocarpa UHCC 0038]